MITLTDLKKRRGWTDYLIKKYLPIPKEYPNPRSKHAGNIKLYDEDKAKLIEASEEFMADLLNANKRKAGAKQAVKTKTQRLLDEMEKYNPTIEIVPIGELEQKAKDHYNERKIFSRSSRKDVYSVPETQSQFTRRITLNYLRHQLSDYDKQLKTIASKIGVNDAYGIIREKIESAILKAYPHLA